MLWSISTLPSLDIKERRMKMKVASIPRRKEGETLEKQLDKCCDQMVILHHRAIEMKMRYKKAKRLGQTSSANSFRLQMEVFMNMYNLYHKSASRRAQHLEELAIITHCRPMN